MMKKIYVFIGMLFCSAVVFGQSNMFIQGVNTWNTTNTNWGTVSGSSGKVWKNNSTANLELSPVINLSGFNPFVYGINCTSTGSFTPSASERIYLAGASPIIDVTAGQTLTLNNIMAGGRGFSKAAAGNLVFGNGNNRFLNFTNGININGGTIDFANSASIASGALRSMPVNLGGNTLQYTGLTASDMRFGGLSGTGTLSLGATNSGFEFITASASTAATITGANLTIRGTAGAVQTFTGNTSGLTTTFAVQGVSTLDGAGGVTNAAKLSGGGSNRLDNATNLFAIRGGRFTIDNTTNNLTTRFPAAATNGMISFLGGTFELLGNSTGTSFTIGSGYGATALKATAFNAGQNNIIVNQPAAAAGPTVLTFGSGSTAASLRDATRMTINFSSTGTGTLGATAADPQIKYATAPIVTTTSTTAPNNMLATSTNGALVGWATVNNTDWATYGPNGVVARSPDLTTATTAGLQGGTVTQTVLFNPSVAPLAATGTVASSVIIFEPQVAGLTLPMAGFPIAGIALMHRGTNSFTITGTTGILAGAAATRYIYVMNPSAVLSTNALLNSANPFNKAGDGTFALTGTVSQIAFGSNQNINLCGGVLRGTAAALGGAASTGGPNSTLNFYGGVLELDGVMTFSRAIDLAGAAGGGGMNFDVSGTQRGSGGFSAINGNSSVTLVTTVGGATPAALLWNNGAWLSDGYTLLMGSNLSDSKITLTNNVGLDDGTATNSYTAREVYVYDNVGSVTDEGELSGIISGGPNADLLKGGPGTLRLSNTGNTYSGNTIVSLGTLVATGTGVLPATTSVLVKTTATLQLLADNTITDLILESGSILDLGTNTLTLTGNLSNYGGVILGTGTIVFNGTSQQYIDGVPVTLYKLTINNTAGMQLLTGVTVNNLLTFTSGIITTTAANLLTISASGSTTAAYNGSCVYGPVKKIGNTQFTFPVGKANGYVPIGIDVFVGGTSSDEFTAEYIRASARALGPVTAGPGLDHVSYCDYWTLDRGLPTPVSVDVKGYWSANNVCGGAVYINNLATLTMAHFDGAGWNSFPVSPVLTGGSTITAGSITWPTVTAFSPFSLAGSTFGLNPLPISINYFNGTRNNGNHLLNWKVTCVSVPSATIELERSVDGRNYSSIYSIFATALRCQQPFDYTDNQPAKGINYYRLKMTDVNGKVTYSEVVTLINAVKGIDIMNIAPNPVVNSRFDLKVSTAQNTKMEIVIADMAGRMMQKQAVTAIAGFNNVPVNAQNLAAGTYQLYVYTEEGRSRILRFVIQ